jgi:hypothetical protein
LLLVKPRPARPFRHKAPHAADAGWVGRAHSGQTG